ncbi:MAG: hypothetical protein ACREGB_01410, partial [Candidatus Saccharimonadales bacterium]
MNEGLFRELPPALWHTFDYLDFKTFVKAVFGFDSPKIVKLVAEKLVMDVETIEYQVALPGLRRGTPRRVSCYDGTDMEPQMRIIRNDPWLLKSRLMEKRTRREIDLTLLWKGLIFQGVITDINHMQELLQRHARTAPLPTHTDVARIQNFIREFSPARQLRFIRATDWRAAEIGDPISHAFTLRNLWDTTEQYWNYKEYGIELPDRWNSIAELHDAITKICNNIQA